MITHDPEYLTVREAASALRVSVPTIRRWIRSGQLRAFRVGKRSTRIRREDLQPQVKRIETAVPVQQDIVSILREEQAAMLARRDGRPFSSSVPIIREGRRERSAQF